MDSLFFIYKETFVLLLIAGVFLPYLGVHLLARNRILETFTLSQGVVFGHLLAQLLILFVGGVSVLFTNFTIGLVAIFFTYLFIQWSSPFFSKHKTSFLFMVGLILMAFSYGISSLYPFLESSVARGFTGDLVTASSQDVVFSSILLSVILSVFIFFHHSLRSQTLNLALFGKEYKPPQKGRLIFDSMVLLTLSTSILVLGHLYSLGALLVVPLLLNILNIPFNLYLKLCVFLGSLSSFMGLGLSLYWSYLSTVPLILLLFCLSSLLVIIFMSFYHKVLLSK